jgi:hypothetical protein
MLSRCIARFLLPVLGIICGVQNNILKNNYSDLRLDPVFSYIYITLGLLMAIYFGTIIWYLISKRKMNGVYHVLIGISFGLFIAGVLFPYTPQGNDALSLRHVDFVFIAMVIYLGVLIKYITVDERIFYFQKTYLFLFVFGTVIIFSFSLMVNSLLETWGLIGMSNLLNRLYEKEKGFDI